MRKLIVAVVFVLAGAVNAFGQSTTVSGQVTDNGCNRGITPLASFSSCLIRISLRSSPTRGLAELCRKSSTAQQTGAGAYSVSVPSNTAISPGGSKWILEVTPNATSPSFSTPATTITGGTQTLNVTPRAIAISWSLPPGPAISAYADAEITGTLPEGRGIFQHHDAVNACVERLGVGQSRLEEAGRDARLQGARELCKRTMVAVDAKRLRSPTMARQ